MAITDLTGGVKPLAAESRRSQATEHVLPVHRLLPTSHGETSISRLLKLGGLFVRRSSADST